MRLNSSVLRIARDALARAERQLNTRSEEDVVENWMLIPSFHYSYWATASVMIKVKKWVSKFISFLIAFSPDGYLHLLHFY